MPQISELSNLLFRGLTTSITNDTKIIFGTALSDSENGEVLVALDEAIYSLGLDESEYEYVNLAINDDVSGIDDDADASTDIVYYEEG